MKFSSAFIVPLVKLNEGTADTLGPGRGCCPPPPSSFGTILSTLLASAIAAAMPSAFGALTDVGSTVARGSSLGRPGSRSNSGRESIFWSDRGSKDGLVLYGLIPNLELPTPPLILLLWDGVISPWLPGVLLLSDAAAETLLGSGALKCQPGRLEMSAAILPVLGEEYV